MSAMIYLRFYHYKIYFSPMMSSECASTYQLYVVRVKTE